MPLTPLKAAKSGNNNENRIEPGSILEYEQHSNSILAVAVSERKGKWSLINQHGGELELAAQRLYLLPGKIPDSASSKEDKVNHLESLAEELTTKLATVKLEEVWQLMLGEVKQTSIKEVAEVLFSSNDLISHLCSRRSLLSDEIFFKRKKNGFEPRPESVVEELKVKVRIERQKREKREKFVALTLARLKDKQAELPEEVELLVHFAAKGKNFEEAKEAKELLTLVIEKGKLSYGGRPEDKAFKLLVDLGRFGPNENILPLKLGRPLEFSPKALEEAEQLRIDVEAELNNGRLDYRHIDTVTIDGEETRDFDDALSVEEIDGGLRIGIHISDVSGLVLPNSELEQTAYRRATSIYCPDEMIPMLPPSISENSLSLVEGTVRTTLAFFIDVDSNYQIVKRSISRAVINVTKRLSYDDADSVLCEDASLDLPLEKMLLCLWNLASATETRRLQAGALQLNRRELIPKVIEGGKVVLEEATDDKPGRKLVSELMILANETAALFGRDNNIPMLFRSQEAPDQDIETATEHIPEGPAREYYRRSCLKRSAISTDAQPHFGLGLEAYTQTTSPIRRAGDLINQRQIASFLMNGTPAYDSQEILNEFSYLDQGLDEAFQIQRTRTRYWLLKYLVQENIKELGATIIKTDGSRPLAELDILLSLQPFHTLKKKTSDPNSKEIGREVRLAIDSIAPRSDSLVLREVE